MHWIRSWFFAAPLEGAGGDSHHTLFGVSSDFQWVEVNDELVWELGQTCEAARNGINIPSILYMLLETVGCRWMCWIFLDILRCSWMFLYILGCSLNLLEDYWLLLGFKSLKKYVYSYFYVDIYANVNAKKQLYMFQIQKNMKFLKKLSNYLLLFGKIVHSKYTDKKLV